MYTWWTESVEASDQVRQRVAFALSEIFVISDRDPNLEHRPLGVVNYYDLMIKHALGNYRTLLEEVTLNPMMGLYLTMIRNSKANEEEGTVPDENYAREALQLFSIGLHELYPDGTLVLDEDGGPINTYGQETVLAFARAFTGWTFSGAHHFFFQSFHEENHILPMMAFEAFHDTQPKTLLRGEVVPGRQTAYEDIVAAMDNIFAHPNVGPFISRRLIQRLVTSNPSPGYIYRVAAQFDDNGQGVRGDLKAVVKAILLDPEARDPSLTKDPAYGKQREPVLRLSHILRAFHQFFNGNPPNYGRAMIGSEFAFLLGQAPLSAPSVFNFFEPDYSPPGILETRGLFAPEFQISSEIAVIGTANYFHEGIAKGFHTESEEGGPLRLRFDYEQRLEEDSVALVEHLDLLLMSGTMSKEMKHALVDLLNEINDEELNKVRSAVQLIATSPEYVIQK